MSGTAELIFTGDELLRGDIVNSNQAFLGEALLAQGLFVTHALSVADDEGLIAEAIRSALARSPQVLILSGGLGPTEDDLTREAVTRATGRPLVFRQGLMDAIDARFAALGIVPTPSNRKQAFLPDGAQEIDFSGTAPGFWFVENDVLVAALPGVPRELFQMWEETLEAVVAGHTRREGESAGVVVRRLRVSGMGESALADALRELPWHEGGLVMGTRAAIDGLTLVLRSDDTAEGHRRLEEAEARAREILGLKVFGQDDDDMAAVLGDLLLSRGLTVGTAESCTGGLVAKRLTDTPGSSRYFLGGVVTYSNELKSRLLGVDPAFFPSFGAVSEEVAVAMAEGARRTLGADCAIAVTGIAGPEGGTPQKPVGLVYIATAVRDRIEARGFTLFSTREEIRARSAHTALDLLRRRLLAEPPASTPGAEGPRGPHLVQS
jgi:nicotinamide-nucleotide amidase